MSEQITPNTSPTDAPSPAPTDSPPNRPTPDPNQRLMVSRPDLEQIHAHLTSAYRAYQTRRLRQAILILEHILQIRS